MRFVLSVLILCISTPAFAGIPCIILRGYTDGGPTTALISPAGLAPSLADQGIIIEVEILDCGEIPIVNFPFQDIWVSDPGTGELALCQGGSMADANTDANGYTTISGVVFGGGYTEGGTLVYVNGEPALDAGPMPLNFVSPDLDGDRIVDITDFSIFGLDFGSTAMRSDFVPDGIVDLADFSTFGVNFHSNCP